MAAFEDEGYFCVDNLPSEMIRSLVDLFMHAGSKVQHAAVVSDVRGGSYFEGLAEMLDDLRAAGVTHRVLFLDADEQTLLTRYKETRRRHPLAPEGSVAEGIARERELLRAAARARRRRDQHVRSDRGDAAAQARRRAAADAHPGASGGHVPELRLQVRAGRDPDLLLDVRFLPNPHYEPGPAAADRRGPADRRVHQPRRGARDVLRAAAPAARLPAAAVPGRGQGASRGGDRLHRRAPPVGGDRRASRRAATAPTAEYLVHVVHRDVSRPA